MASAGIGATLPLWRIHNFTALGTTASIINIARDDTIALLRFLSGGSDPLSASGNLTLAVDYAADLSSLQQATLVRIKSVSPGDKPGQYSAELTILCKARVEDVSTRGSFPTARRATDLAPLWRIHNLGGGGESEVKFDAEEKQITNIAREDTVAILRSLGDGNARRAGGHLVLACDYKKDLHPGFRAMLVRIGEVDYLSEKPGPPYKSTVKYLGHVRSAKVFTDGQFPRCLLEEMPVWRIHNLNKVGGRTHQITNIARPDSVALLTHLGMGNPLNATGALVIGCDYESPPFSGESGRLMRVAKVGPSTGSGKYEAVLVDVDTVSIGQVRTSSQQDSWWPRVAIQLPKVWRSSESSPAPVPVTPTPRERPPRECLYFQRCEHALIKILRDAGFDHEFEKSFRQKDADRCFCVDCHRLRGDQLVYSRGGEKYVIPVGFVRIGLKIYKEPSLVARGFKEWHVCYHGTKYQYLPDILSSGQLLKPGNTTFLGNRIAVQEGHIKKSFERTNEHTGKKEYFDPANFIFFSPTVKYCDYTGIYMNEYRDGERSYRVALQVHLEPCTYMIGQQTVGAKSQIDEHIPNSSIEWYATKVDTHFFTGVLMAER